MFKKGIIGKFGNVAKLEFEDKREQAIYNLGIDAGERQSAMTDTVYQLGIMTATFIFYKVVDYAIRKIINEDQEEIIEQYMEDLEQ